MTPEEARENLETWLDLAARNPIFNKYDKLCNEAYGVLSSEEYDKIYKRWSGQYTFCADGYYRKF